MASLMAEKWQNCKPMYVYMWAYIHKFYGLTTTLLLNHLSLQFNGFLLLLLSLRLHTDSCYPILVAHLCHTKTMLKTATRMSFDDNIANRNCNKYLRHPIEMGRRPNVQHFLHFATFFVAEMSQCSFSNGSYKRIGIRFYRTFCCFHCNSSSSSLCCLKIVCWCAFVFVIRIKMFVS